MADRISITFTWDDNLSTHFTHIGKLFEEAGLRCTFYVVPGDIHFSSQYAQGYKELHQKGFDIGSHSYSHPYMSKLAPEIADKEFIASIEAISGLTDQYPLSFAFPYHDYTKELVNKARTFHLESRNTLPNSVVYHLKSNSSLENLVYAVHKSVLANTNLVFSGHSILTEENFTNKLPGEGYQPLRFSVLSSLLDQLKTLPNTVEILTFSKAALRAFIRSNSTLENDTLILNQDSEKKLAIFGINPKNIYSFI